MEKPLVISFLLLCFGLHLCICCSGVAGSSGDAAASTDVEFIQTERELEDNNARFRRILRLVPKGKGQKKLHRDSDLWKLQISPEQASGPIRQHHRHKHNSAPSSPSAGAAAPAPTSQLKEQRGGIFTPPPFESLPAVSPATATHTREVDSEGQKTSSWNMYVSIAAGVASLLAISAGIIFCFRVNKVVTVRPWATGLSGQLQKAFVTGAPALKRCELQVACEDFSNIIGSGPDCIKYKGTLSSGVEIAVISSTVKSSKHWSKHFESQFRKKITNLSKVNHRNFMNFLGYCEEDRPFTRMMVFEYAPNGTLFEHLHCKYLFSFQTVSRHALTTHSLLKLSQDKEADHLDWQTRLRIAMGVAYCLEYMLKQSPPLLLHRLHSSAVHLTDDFAAKVADLYIHNEPEMDGDNESTDAGSIVYRYGIILLEIISGTLPDSDEDGMIEKWATKYFSSDIPLAETTDPSLKDFQEETLIQLQSVIKSCIVPEPEKRPTMPEVVRRLQEITAMTPDRVTPRLSPLWWAELEIAASDEN